MNVRFLQGVELRPHGGDEVLQGQVDVKGGQQVVDVDGSKVEDGQKVVQVQVAQGYVVLGINAIWKKK